MADCTLGCGDYEVLITDRCSTSSLCTLDGATVLDLEFTRLLDETGDALVTVATQGAGCCDCGTIGLGDLHVWRHVLVIARDGERVWEGPITSLTYSADALLIEARDHSAWLAQRTTKVADTFVGVDLATIAETLVRDAYDADDPCLEAYVDATPTGIDADRTYEVDDGYIADHLRDLAETGLDWTQLGRALIITGEVGAGVVATLNDGDFLEGLEVVEDGLALCTRAIVQGDGVTGVAGGVDTYYGLHDCLVDADEVLDQASATAAAQGRVDASNPGPVYVRVPDGASLAPTAGVCFNDLVPGTLFTVRSSITCRDVAATLRLVELSVTVSGGEESVAPVLVPVGLVVD